MLSIIVFWLTVEMALPHGVGQWTTKWVPHIRGLALSTTGHHSLQHHPQAIASHVPSESYDCDSLRYTRGFEHLFRIGSKSQLSERRYYSLIGHSNGSEVEFECRSPIHLWWYSYVFTKTKGIEVTSFGQYRVFRVRRYFAEKKFCFKF